MILPPLPPLHFLFCPQSFLAHTIHPTENMTKNFHPQYRILIQTIIQNLFDRIIWLDYPQKHQSHRCTSNWEEFHTVFVRNERRSRGDFRELLNTQDFPFFPII